VGELSPAMQVKLLRVLQEKQLERVGGEETTTVDVRVISATNRDLRQMVRTGTMREDLYFRLAVVPIDVPPLRARGTDILLLVDHFLSLYAEEMGRAHAPSLSEEATRQVMAYRWPGNVRELQNSLQFALVKASGSIIETEHLPAEVAGAEERVPARAGRKRKLDAGQVRDALEQCDGNRVKAAKLLGVGRSTLYRYLEEMSLPIGLVRHETSRNQNRTRGNP